MDKTRILGPMIAFVAISLACLTSRLEPVSSNVAANIFILNYVDAFQDWSPTYLLTDRATQSLDGCKQMRLKPGVTYDSFPGASSTANHLSNFTSIICMPGPARRDSSAAQTVAERNSVFADYFLGWAKIAENDETAAIAAWKPIDGLGQFLALEGILASYRDSDSLRAFRLFELAEAVDDSVLPRKGPMYTLLCTKYLTEQPIDLVAAEVNCSKRFAVNDDGTGHLLIGRLFLESGEYELAADHFRQAQQLMPNEYAPHFWLAELAFRIGEPRSAIAYLQKATSLDPENLQITLRLSDAFRLSNLPNESLELLESIPSSKSDEVSADIVWRRELLNKMLSEQHDQDSK